MSAWCGQQDHSLGVSGGAVAGGVRHFLCEFISALFHHFNGTVIYRLKQFRVGEDSKMNVPKDGSVVPGLSDGGDGFLL